jgi:putrescine transport system permease protein
MRGMGTIWIAHTTFATAFVTVVVASRLTEMDRSLDEAAMDLGANRLKVFFVITCRLSFRPWWPAGCWRSRCRWTTW